MQGHDSINWVVAVAVAFIVAVFVVWLLFFLMEFRIFFSLIGGEMFGIMEKAFEEFKWVAGKAHRFSQDIMNVFRY